MSLTPLICVFKFVIGIQMENGNNSSFKILWNSWDKRNKAIFSSSIIALISLFFPWLNDLGDSEYGVALIGGWISWVILLPLLSVVIVNKPYSKILVLAYAFFASIYPLILISAYGGSDYSQTKTSFGLYLFLFAIIRVGLSALYPSNINQIDKVSDQNIKIAVSPTERIPCPKCAELIMKEANICRFCGNEVGLNLKVTPQNDEIS